MRAEQGVQSGIYQLQQRRMRGMVEKSAMKKTETGNAARDAETVFKMR